MGKDKFEQYFQSVFEKHEVSIDTDEIWAGIEPSLPPTKTNSSNNLWLLGLAALIIIGAVAIYGISNKNKSIERGQATQALVQSRLENQNQTSDDKQNTAAILSDNDESKDGLTEMAIGQQNKSISQQASDRLASEELNTTTNNQLRKSTTPSEQKSTTASNRVTKKEIESNNTPNTSFSVLSDASSEDFEGQQNITPVSSESDEYNAENVPVFESEAEYKPARSLNTLSRSQVEERVTFSSLSQLRRDLALMEDDASQLITSLPTLNDCYDFSLRSWIWTLDTYVGFNYAAKSLKYKDNVSVGEDYISARENTESYLEAFDAGIALSAIHRKGYLASVGINYSQIDEKLNYFLEETTTRFDSVVVRIEIDSAGRADSIREWRPITVNSTKQILTYNYYRMVDIPVSLGYQFHKGQWTFEVQGGVMFNLLLKKKGEIRHPSNSGLVDFTDNDLVFKDRLGLTVFGGIKAIYPLTDRIGLYVEPHARVNLKSMTVDAYPLAQRYNQFGLHVGARWIF